MDAGLPEGTGRPLQETRATVHPPDDDNLTPATASSEEEGVRAPDEGTAEGTASNGMADDLPPNIVPEGAGPDGRERGGDAVGGAGEAAPRLDISRRTSWLQLIIVCIASFATWTGFGAIMPYLPLFLKEEEHSSMVLIGVIASMFYVGTLLFSSPLGWASDTFGRKPIMVFGVTLVRLRHGAVHDDEQTPTGSSSSGCSRASGRPPSAPPAKPSSPTSPTTRTAARPTASSPRRSSAA